MRNRFSCFVAMAVLVTACADMSTPSTPSSSATTTTQSSPVPGRQQQGQQQSQSRPTRAQRPAPNQPGRVELKGAMAGLNGRALRSASAIAGSPVSTVEPRRRSRTALAATLKNGDQVEVEGARQANNVLMAY